MAQRITFKPSTENVRWSMVMPWSKGLLFYDIASHMADSIRLASAGRLNIRVYAAEELVPAMQSFDAVSVGTAEVGHDWPGYWKGKNEAFNAFASVPFGLDGEGYNIWLYEKGGLEMMQELYGRLTSTPCRPVSAARRWGCLPTSAPPAWQTSKACAFAPSAGTWTF
jgi:TRAP-type mannitol/chloroaromatic compound transport system substrate-binding protein